MTTGVLVNRLLVIALGWTFIFGIVPMPNILSMQSMHMENMVSSPASATDSLIAFSDEADQHTPMPCCDAIGQFSMPCSIPFIASQSYPDIPAGASERVALSLFVFRSIALNLPAPPPKI